MAVLEYLRNRDTAGTLFSKPNRLSRENEPTNRKMNRIFKYLLSYFSIRDSLVYNFNLRPFSCLIHGNQNGFLL